jgi:hypothetical protein
MSRATLMAGPSTAMALAAVIGGSSMFLLGPAAASADGDPCRRDGGEHTPRPRSDRDRGHRGCLGSDAVRRGWRRSRPDRSRQRRGHVHDGQSHQMRKTPSVLRRERPLNLPPA